MIIDFHTHIFPDPLAKRALSTLVESIDHLYTPVSDGTLAGLIRNMDEWQIDFSVVQPVVTKQSQVKTINEWAQSIRSPRILSFGGIYPHSDHYKQDIDFVVGLGLPGLKFHAEHQNFLLDEPKMLKIYDYAFSKGLILLHHGGFDPGFSPPIKTSPQRFAKIARDMQGGIMIAAHLGGHSQWDDVERYLVGTNVYLDTSMGYDIFPGGQYLRIIQDHGADKVLFGSDAPWSNAQEEIARIQSLPLPKQDLQAILGGNARRILKI